MEFKNMNFVFVDALKPICLLLVIVFLTACGGGNSSSGNSNSNVSNGPLDGLPGGTPPAAMGTDFTEVAIAAGLTHETFCDPDVQLCRLGAYGVSAADYDGWVDIYVTTNNFNGGGIAGNILYKNNGDGTFSNVTATAAVAKNNTINTSAIFGDINGDNQDDLIAFSTDSGQPSVFINNGDGTFTDGSSSSGISLSNGANSATLGDYDRDGDLDLITTIFNVSATGQLEYLWRNNGSGVFTNVTIPSGINATYPHPNNARGASISNPQGAFDYTPNFVDIDNDGWLDIVQTSDYSTSHVLRNNTDGTFTDISDHGVLTETDSVGAAIFDYDNDGDFDWFVASFDERATDRETSGNEMFRNDGTGVFEKVTSEASVRIGSIAWAACAADFNKDGHQDIFHVNGWRRNVGGGQPKPEWVADLSRLFISNGDGTFSNQSGMVDDRADGRTLVCFDYDQDGDIDILVGNMNQPPRLFRNDIQNNNNYITILLDGLDGNHRGIGSKVFVSSSAGTQLQDMRAGSNYASQNPAELLFGAETDTQVDIRVEWLDGAVSNLSNVAVNQRLTIAHP